MYQIGRLRAFTLIEVLVFTGLLISISTIAVVLATPQLLRERSENTAREIASAVSGQQQSAYSGLYGKSYGVKFNNSWYSTFVGDSWDTRESEDTFEFQAGTTIEEVDLTGGGTEVIFASEAIIPSTSGEIVLAAGEETYAVTINSQGLIDYEAL